MEKQMLCNPSGTKWGICCRNGASAGCIQTALQCKISGDKYG